MFGDLLAVLLVQDNTIGHQWTQRIGVDVLQRLAHSLARVSFGEFPSQTFGQVVAWRTVAVVVQHGDAVEFGRRLSGAASGQLRRVRTVSAGRMSAIADRRANLVVLHRVQHAASGWRVLAQVDAAEIDRVRLMLIGFLVRLAG